MMEETDSLLSETHELPPSRPSTPKIWHSLRFYLKQPKILDWIIVGLLVGAIVMTLIICL